MNRLGHFVEYAALRVMVLVFNCLPLPLFYSISRWMGYVAFDVFHIRREVTLGNLRIALGDEYTDAELTHIARAAYGNIAITFAEVLIYPRLKTRITKMVDYTGFEKIEEAVKAGHGVIVVTCHYGSWEFVANAISAKGIPVAAVGKTQSNPYSDRFLGERRAFMGINVVSRGSQVRQLVGALRNGESIILVSDQDAGRRGVFVPFFGVQASTPTGAAQLALRYKVPIIAMVCERTGDGSYRMIIRQLSVDDEDTVEEITARMNEILGNIIRRDPGQYFWMHKRWKTRPPDGPEIVFDGQDVVTANMGGES